MFSYADTDKVKPNAHNVDIKLVPVERKLASTGFREAPGQPRDGYIFPSSGGFIMWRNGGNNVALSVSLSTIGKPYSLSLSLGSASSSAFGTGVNVPKEYLNRHVKLYVNRTTEVVVYKVYEKRENTNTPWKFARYETRPNPDVRSKFEIRKVF